MCNCRCCSCSSKFIGNLALRELTVYGETENTVTEKYIPCMSGAGEKRKGGGERLISK